MECFQPTGSFKPRGMETIIAHFTKKGIKSFVTSSGGNAGFGLAFICENIGVKLKVIVPKTTSTFMIAKIEALSAEVEVVGNDWNAADNYAQQLTQSPDVEYIHPFDHPKLWEGYSKIIDECALQMEQPHRIVLAVGGGGLLSGVLEGIERNKWEDVEIITSETVGAASFYESQKAGHVITLNEIDTIANSISSKRVSERSFNRSLNFEVTAHLVSDQEALEACTSFLDENNVLVEPACGAALAVSYKLAKSNPDEIILAIVCGGSGFSLNQYLKNICV